MTNGGAARPLMDDVRAVEAAQWLSGRVLHDDRVEDVDFEMWLGTGPENRAAYARAEALWQDLDHVVALQPERSMASVVALKPRRRGFPVISTLAIAASLAVAAISLPMLVRQKETGFATRVGEQRIVLLEDQSKVTLNTDTKLSVAFDKQGRRIDLEQGEALFEVARDTARPFVVHVGRDEVRAVGTAFIVRRDRGRLFVTLIHGKVMVTDGDNTGSAPFMLEPGERAVLDGAAGVTRDRPQLNSVTAWQHGEMILRETPVMDAVREMNRYNGQQIEVASPGLGSQTLTGVFKLGRNREFANTLSALYNLEMSARGDAIILRERKKN